MFKSQKDPKGILDLANDFIQLDPYTKLAYSTGLPTDEDIQNDSNRGDDSYIVNNSINLVDHSDYYGQSSNGNLSNHQNLLASIGMLGLVAGYNISDSKQQEYRDDKESNKINDLFIKFDLDRNGNGILDFVEQGPGCPGFISVHQEMTSPGVDLETNKETSQLDWIPDVMQLDGTSEEEQYLVSRINSLNNRISNQDLKWNQEKINQLWDASQIIYDEYGIQVDPCLLLAIIFQEGTGSFNTSATNLAADGQHGVETDFARDLMKANNLVFGKILGYVYYGGDFNQSVVSNNNQAGISGDGNFFQYANWNTPIIDLDRGNVRYGVYAGHGAWHEGVEGMYEKLSYDGASSEYSEYLSSVNKETILNITNGISLPNVVFTPSQTSQDHLGNPNGEYIIQGKATR